MPSTENERLKDSAERSKSVIRRGITLAFPVRRSGLSTARVQNGSLRESPNQAFGIEYGFVDEHEVSGASDLDGEHRVGFKLVSAHAGFEFLGEWP